MIGHARLVQRGTSAADATGCADKAAYPTRLRVGYVA